MAKKILAIFFVSILLCSYIIPTTSAFADVVIGDNDSYAVTELGVQNGKRIATMEALLQLLESGVSEINFNDISDLDDYIDDFYNELTNINYQDVSNEILAGAYNDVKELKQWIDDRGEYIGTYYKDYLNSADQGLSNIFNDFQLKLPKSKLVGTSLNGVRGMSRFTRPIPTPSPDSNYSFIDNLQFIKGRTTENTNDIRDLNSYSVGQIVRAFDNASLTVNYSVPVSYCGIDLTNYHTATVGNSTNILTATPCVGIGSIYLTTNDNNTINAHYVNCTYNTHPINNWNTNVSLQYVLKNNYLGTQTTGTTPVNYLQSNFSNLSEAINYVYKHYAYVNLYVDNVPWALVSDSPSNIPTLDIDGFIKLYGNNNPIQYEFPQGTQIDYNALYTTIYNAIRDNFPLDMQTINNNQVYYDSHDTVYSPTIYNYYGKDGDDENDWIDSILDYATIPDFNAVLGTVAVLDAPFVNGITIVNAGVTDVIPTDILVILGGFFVLVLFVCIINRMSE